jgi:ribosome-interacting GTPase 1
MTDVKRVGAFAHMVSELQGSGIRINQKRPNILIEKKTSGGLEIFSNLKQEIDKETMKEIAREYGIKNADITLKEKLSYERLFDAFSENRVYIPAIFVINKTDMEPKYKDLIEGDFVGISADKEVGIEGLIDQIWKTLKFVTVYLVKPDQKPNRDNPIIMKEGETLKDIAEKIGTEFARSKKLVKIWGESAKFPGQEVSFETNVKEGMQIMFL